MHPSRLRSVPTSTIPEDEAVNMQTAKWLRFNDTLVDDVTLNDPTMEVECFGGTYKAKSHDSKSHDGPPTSIPLDATTTSPLVLLHSDLQPP